MAKREAAKARPGKEAPKRRTHAEIVADVKVLLGEVDQKMAQPRRFSVSWEGYYRPDLLKKEGDRLTKLIDEAWTLVNPKREQVWNSRFPQRDKIEEKIRDELALPNGEVPTWARAGRFVVWLAHIPIVISWGGFIDPGEFTFGPASVGGHCLHGKEVYVSRFVPPIKSEWKTPADMMRGLLVDSTKHAAFSLLTMTPSQRNTVQTFLAKPENAWIVPLVAAGPVNPVDLPDRLMMLPQELTFA